jgi:hypothetical protein
VEITTRSVRNLLPHRSRQTLRQMMLIVETSQVAMLLGVGIL